MLRIDLPLWSPDLCPVALSRGDRDINVILYNQARSCQGAPSFTSDGLIRLSKRTGLLGLAAVTVTLLVLGVCVCVACHGCGLLHVSVCGSCPCARSSERRYGVF